MVIDQFEAAVAAGDVTRTDHGSLSLYTYSAACAYERRWSEITRAARGIIFDRETGAVVARPFDKFFNLGEVPETSPDALPASGFSVEEKLDGSLGIVFQHEGRWRVATKGSFTSDQAQYAESELLPRVNLGGFPRGPGVTLLFEIIYPDNRIVLDYGQRSELVLLGVRETSGAEWDASRVDAAANILGVSRPRRYDHRNLLDLPMSDTLDMEGYVVRFSDHTRVKVKSPRYVQVHRLLEYRSPRRILDMIEDDTLASIRSEIPDALAADFDDVSAALNLSLYQIEDEARRVFNAVQPVAPDRKTFAQLAQKSASGRALPLVFAMLDERPTRPLAIRAVRNGLKEQPPASAGERG